MIGKVCTKTAVNIIQVTSHIKMKRMVADVTIKQLTAYQKQIASHVMTLSKLKSSLFDYFRNWRAINQLERSLSALQDRFRIFITKTLQWLGIELQVVGW